MEHQDVNTKAMADIFADNKSDIIIETEVNSVVEIDEIHIKVECDIEDEDYRATEDSKIQTFDSYEDSLTGVYCDISSTYCKDTETLEKHLGANPEGKEFDNVGQSADIEYSTAKPLRYICEFCNKSFNHKSDIEIHKILHTGVKPYSCDNCDKSFAYKGNLYKHEFTHTEASPYSCNICNKFFTQKSDLNKHRFTHTGGRPYSCHMCNKTFAQKGHFNFHNRVHAGVKPYSCDLCNKSFAQKGDLNKHKLTHTRVRPFLCNVCNKSFVQKIHLDKHNLTHTGAMPHRCDICMKSFNHKSKLKRHLQSIHRSTSVLQRFS